MGEHVVLLIDSSSVVQCRICREEEEEDYHSMETPCACSGTLKFAHRNCIQRWCDEKGNTTCEICLQKFEPGYKAPPKPVPSNSTSLNIRSSLEIPRENQVLHNPGLMAIIAADGEAIESDSEESTSESDRSSSCCRSVALTFTIIFLVRHIIPVLTGGAEEYVSTLFTLFILRVGGVVLPFYIMAKVITTMQRRHQLQQHHQHDENLALARAEAGEEQQRRLMQV